MADSDTFVRHCDIAVREGSYGEAAGRDRWRAPTFELMVKRVRGNTTQLVIVTGLRFDRPTEAIERVMRARA